MISEAPELFLEDTSAVSQGQKIIKTASLSAVVDSVSDSSDQIVEQTTTLGGFVQNSTITENRKGQKFANLTLRVPAVQFENLINHIKSLANLIEREDIRGREVTEEYVDLQADLTHLQAVEAQYLELLKRADEVEEIIAVRNKLDQVQREIQRITGRIRYLDDQTQMSTISVSLSEEVSISFPEDKWQPWVTLKQGFQNFIIMLQNFINNIIVWFFLIIGLIPYLLVLGIIYLIVRKVYKNLKKKK